MSDGISNSAEQTSTTETPRARPWRRWAIRLLVLVALVGAGGWSAAQFGVLPAWARKAPRLPQLFAHEAKPGALPLEPFTVNLADTESSRFLRCSLQLVVDDESQVKKIEGDGLRMMRVRSAILELLTQQTADRLNTPDGKQALKQAIITRASTALQPAKVTDVLFADFVIQF